MRANSCCCVRHLCSPACGRSPPPARVVVLRARLLEPGGRNPPLRRDGSCAPRHARPRTTLRVPRARRRDGVRALRDGGSPWEEPRPLRRGAPPRASPRRWSPPTSRRRARDARARSRGSRGTPPPRRTSRTRGANPGRGVRGRPRPRRGGRGGGVASPREVRRGALRRGRASRRR